MKNNDKKFLTTNCMVLLRLTAFSMNHLSPTSVTEIPSWVWCVRRSSWVDTFVSYKSDSVFRRLWYSIGPGTIRVQPWRTTRFGFRTWRFHGLQCPDVWQNHILWCSVHGYANDVQWQPMCLSWQVKQSPHSWRACNNAYLKSEIGWMQPTIGCRYIWEM